MENYDFVNEKGSWKLTHHVSSVQMTLFFFCLSFIVIEVLHMVFQCGQEDKSREDY